MRHITPPPSRAGLPGRRARRPRPERAPTKVADHKTSIASSSMSGIDTMESSVETEMSPVPYS